jgi:uncharacterized GH25 family protein
MNRIRNCLAAVVLAAAAVSAQAHYLWIENSGGAAILRFGEFAENERERSPGRLDEIPDPQAIVFADGKGKPVALQRGAEGFTFAQVKPGAQLVAQESRMSVRDWSKAGIGIVKPMFYARAGLAGVEAKPELPFDIVPTGNADEFRIWFKQQPLAKAAVTIYAPNGWSQEHRTDADGKVALARPWQGQYVIEAIFLERTAGEFEGKPFEAIRHRATLTLEQKSGPTTFAPTGAAMH